MKLKELLLQYGYDIRKDHSDENFKMLENLIGQRFWVCDYTLDFSFDINNLKPVRKVNPTYVELVDGRPNNRKHKLKHNTIVYFINVENQSNAIEPYGLNKNGKCHDESIEIFNDEKECKEFFIQQLNKAIDKMEYIKNQQTYQEYIEKCDKQIEKLKITIEQYQ